MNKLGFSSAGHVQSLDVSNARLANEYMDAGVGKWLNDLIAIWAPTGPWQLENQALSRSDQMYKYACTHGYKFGNLIRDSLPSWPNLSPELDPQREAGSPSFLQSHPIFQVVKVQKELGHLSILVSPASASAAL